MLEPILDDPSIHDGKRPRSNRDSASMQTTSRSRHRHHKDVYDELTSSKFRFKSRKRKSEDNNSDGKSSRRHHREREHRTKRPKSTESVDDPTAYDDTYLRTASSSDDVDPDAAFRQSLFDAMADDEGASFWEGVYGQPIPFEKVPKVKEGPTGLEAMTDEEYVAHIRAEMYKKTHQHLIEEKARRDEMKKERERSAKERRKEVDEAERFNRKVEESLRRGQERKARIRMSKEWTQRWRDYEKTWEEFGKPMTMIPWPTWGASKADINKEEVERFFLNAPTAGTPGNADLLKILKAERVRWHPDKVQQKLGGQNADEEKMQGVTAVFQVIDRLWSELRDRK